MIRINLLPPGVRPRRASAILALPWKEIAIGGIALLLVYSGWTFLFHQWQRKTLARLTTEWESLELQRARLEEVKTALTVFRNRASIIQSLRAPEAQWASRLNFISDAVVANLWFTLMAFRMQRTSEAMEFLRKETKHFGIEQYVRIPQDLDKLPGMFQEEGSQETPQQPGVPAAPSVQRPFVYLAGSALAIGEEKDAPVARFLQKIKSHPEFPRWFREVELKSVSQEERGAWDESNFLIVLYPTVSGG